MRQAGLPYPRGCRPARSRISLAFRPEFAFKGCAACRLRVATLRLSARSARYAPTVAAAGNATTPAWRHHPTKTLDDPDYRTLDVPDYRTLDDPDYRTPTTLIIEPSTTLIIEPPTTLIIEPSTTLIIEPPTTLPSTARSAYFFTISKRRGDRPRSDGAGTGRHCGRARMRALKKYAPRVYLPAIA